MAFLRPMRDEKDVPLFVSVTSLVGSRLCIAAAAVPAGYIIDDRVCR